MSPHADFSHHKRVWWKEATFYQIYPASFRDSNGDGWGDIPGVIEKIDYIASLGVDVVWLSPMFDSPQVDMGYDVSNYEGVYGPYGTVADVEELIKACHDNDMKIILDLVVNHTSDQHAWFKESRSSKHNPKRDWYFWEPARYDEQGNRRPPTNYRSYFAGGTWTWDEQTEEYYLHLYDKSQPDLNWENEDCRNAIYDSAMRFWLDKGIDGFRVDTVNKYSKVLPFTDAPITDPTSDIQPAAQMWCNGPRIHEFIKEMNRDVLSHYRTYDGLPVVTVGELSLCPTPSSVLPYISAREKELDMIFQFDITHLGQGPPGCNDKYDFTLWSLSEMKRIVEKWQTSIAGTDAWTTVFNENHDNGRSISRFANDAPQWRTHSAKLLALWLIGQTGSLFLYQGQEIGMINAPKDWDLAREYKDVEAQNYWAEAVRLAENGTDPTRKERIRHGLQLMARDHARLPFQWDGTAHAGFTAGQQPWMRVHNEYPGLNVEVQERDPESVLSFYKAMLRLRKAHRDVFVYGEFELLDREGRETFVYRKRFEDRMAVVVLNFSTGEQAVPGWVGGMSVLVSTYGKSVEAVLRPLEGRIYVDY
ncbi:alpha-glucosidase-like protein maltase [Stemphylium lycopersici]|uniref:Alpha-glucosidase n=1 Tax=Stemphylium lycopersici TaxID=183478 RepID=A0A364NCR6_STELY|nr:maltase [Stemphylium lycopersici]RAR07889.1 alpha-glucosidase-like protein maltase [Stemphylium lycopersici]RAR15118.1 alpha-glucosidase-like protein maltase [Stemphylium lycopersici]